jgi:hypothetical protein
VSWEQLALIGYGVLAGVGYIVSLVHRAWRRNQGEG